MKLKKAGKKKTEKKENKIEIPNIRWRQINNKDVLITNDFGHFAVLKKEDFKKYLKGNIKNKKIIAELEEKGFIRNRLNFEELYKTFQSLNSFIYTGPYLHILVTTLRCNHKCIYCQSQAVGEKETKTDMKWETAKKSIDFAFKSTSPEITLEFQGGEPLLNWDIVKKSIQYARRKEKETRKKLNLALVTNFALMDKEKASFLLENEVSLCTSLDGPEKLHNQNRIYFNGNSYKDTVKWLEYFNNAYDTQQGNTYRIFKPSALITISRYSLDYPEEIVDEYIKNKIDTIFLRPLSPIGFAKKIWDKIGYDADEFLKFYKKAFNYIIGLNKKGINIKEKTAEMLLLKILKKQDPGFVDLRCPCGAGTGQIAYNYNGDVYTCDEGRMVGWEGDNLFKIGNIKNLTYEKMINSSAVKGCAISSNMENQAMCSRCAYRPYCGICPVINYETQNSIWGNNITSQRCKIFMGIFDIIFEKLQNSKENKILHNWIGETNDKV